MSFANSRKVDMSAFDSIQPVLGKHPENIKISNSEIQAFKSCKRKWMLQNYYGLKKKDEDFDGPLPLGIRIHEAMDGYYFQDENSTEVPVDKYMRLQRADNERFVNSPHSSDESKVDKFNKESELGRIMMEGYTEWLEDENPDADIDFVSQEEALEFPLDEFNGRVSLIGKTDAIVRRKFSGAMALLDFKTAQSFDSYRKAAHHSEQMPTYMNLLRRLKPDLGKVDGARYRLLKKVKRSTRATPPFYEDQDVRFNRKALDSHWKRVLRCVEEMVDLREKLDNGEDHQYYAYPTQKMTWECTSCPFFNGCYMLDDGSNAEDFFKDNFTQVDPNARYDNDERENENG